MIGKLKEEKGQAMVLLVLAFIVLLGFTALAIDGGMVYSDRRTSQNAADAASLAGAGEAGAQIRAAGAAAIKENWDCTMFTSGSRWTAITQAAINSASSNNFTIGALSTTPGPLEDDYVYVYCNPKDPGPPYLDVQVKIKKLTNTSFAHFIYNGPLENQVDAVARVEPPPPEAEGSCIISLTDKCTGTDKGTRIEGTSKTHLIGCGAWSNSCTIFNGCSGEFTADNLSYITTSDWDTVDECMDVGPIVQEDNQLKIDIPEPDCGAKPAHPPKENGSPDADPTPIDPGWYDTIKVTGSKNLTMNPGLYCVDGGGFDFSGGTLIGNGVTIVLYGNKGFTAAGTATITLSAPPVGCETSSPSCSPAVGGLLIWVPASNKDNVILTGTTSSSFVGTVFVQEGGGTIILAGTSELASPTFGLSLIGDSVKITGGGMVDITYDSSKTYHGPAFMEMAK
jgi:hypothetical protein